MKTLADFKRLITPGNKFKMTYIPTGALLERTVSIVQSNAVGFSTPDGKTSWLHFPKASECSFEDGKLTISEDGVKLLTYELIP